MTFALRSRKNRVVQINIAIAIHSSDEWSNQPQSSINILIPRVVQSITVMTAATKIK